MLSVVIPTLDHERALVPTLAMLVPGVIAGAVREVIVADGGSTDATREVVEVAGCSLVAAGPPLGARLRAGAHAARGPWLMFLRPGAVLDPSWVAETIRFIAEDGGAEQAAVFTRSPGTARRRGVAAEIAWVLAAAFAAPSPEQGLVLSGAHYRRLGGHRDEPDPEGGLLRRLGRRNLARLRSGISRSGR